MSLRPRALIGFLFIAGTAGCGGGFPALLTTTVRRVEEQGIDYSAIGTSTLEITLRSDGRGRAVRTTHATDVLESDVHATDDAANYEVLGRREAGGLRLILTPDAGQSPLITRVELACAPWTITSRAEPGDATDPSLPGVEWVCELEGENIFALGRVVIEHVPREGAFFLFASSHQLMIQENLSGSLRTVRTERGPPR
jgi:hypothetical protein